MGEQAAPGALPRQFEDVVFESFAEGGPVVATGNWLRIDDAGFTMRAGRAQPAHHAHWSLLSGLRCGDTAVMPGGGVATSIEATVAGHLVRWLVPADQLSTVDALALEGVLQRRSSVTQEDQPVAQEDQSVTQEDKPVTQEDQQQSSGSDGALATPPGAETHEPQPGAETHEPQPESETHEPQPGAETHEPQPGTLAKVEPSPWVGPSVAAMPPAGARPPAAWEPPVLAPTRQPAHAPAGEPARWAPPSARSPAHAAPEPAPGQATAPRPAPAPPEKPAVQPAQHPVEGSPAGASPPPSDTLPSDAQPGPPHPAQASTAFGQPGYGEAAPGTGWWWPAGAVDGQARAQRRQVGPLITVLLVVIVLLVAAAVAVPLAASSGGKAPAPTPAEQARSAAIHMNLVRSDLPSGWTVDPSSAGPLSSFLNNGTGGQQSGQGALQSQVASQFESCMGISAAADRIFGPSGADPLAQTSSPAFAAPSGGPAHEAGSTVAVFSSATPVTADVAQVDDPHFPACFGAALATSFVQAGQQSGVAGAQFGQPQVQPVQAPTRNGVVTAGAEVTVDVTARGVTVPLQFGVVFVGGGRTEATLYTYSAEQPFPSNLSTALAQRLARNVATNGSAAAA